MDRLKTVPKANLFNLVEKHLIIIFKELYNDAMGKSSRRLQHDSEFVMYSKELQSKFKFKESREHAYRPALQNFIEKIEKDIKAINDAARISCGAPDFIVYKNRVPLGYVEAKDINKDLLKEEKSEQIQGYHSLGNLILTDYLKFKWFVNGELRLEISIGETSGNNIVFSEDAEEKLTHLFTSFLSLEANTIRSASELAERLAVSTISIRNLIIRAFDLEDEKTGWLHRWLRAFSEVLIKDLKKETFADMFAQTLTYGFFAARIHHNDKVTFSRFSAATILPKTNPFLRKLFAQFAGAEMPETINWAVDEAVEILKRVDVQSILKDFGTGKEDPVVHFYETFLAAYDPKLRESRGVYYTPTQVVNFIVRSTDLILKKSFGKKMGLADDTTLILDPAVGTGSFLKKVISDIHLNFSKNEGSWNSYVANNLLDRIFGFEILMAPYSVAHMKLGLQLQDTGYKFEKDQRLGIYLTNTLEEAAKKSQELLFDWISDEANAASDVKKTKPIMVVLGNPPYAGNSSNKGKWITDLVKGYDHITQQRTDNYFECDSKPLGEKNSKWLNDDYVKFIRFAQWRIEQTGHGVLSFITNHGFLDNPTFRGMRQSLTKGFDELYLLDLHGNSKKKEKCPDGSKDENVFDIQQGVSICFFIRKPGKHVRNAKIFRSDLFGVREEKYKWLDQNDISSVKWKSVEASSPFYLFTANQDKKLQSDFSKYPKLTEIFPVNVLGFQTHRDQFALSYTQKDMVDRISELRDSSLSPSEIKKRYGLKENQSWSVAAARKIVKSDDKWKSKIVECAYRPYESRWCYLDKAVMDRPRPELQKHVSEKKNLCIISSRQQATSGYFHSWITDLPANDCLISTKSREANQVFPLFLFDSSPLAEAAGAEPTQNANLNKDLIKALENEWKLAFALHDENKKSFTAKQIAFYVYALLNSKLYRETYSDLLKTDFPRIPFAKDSKLFFQLAEVGSDLASIHMMNSKKINGSDIQFPVKGSNKIEKLVYDEKNKMLFINRSQFFKNISKEMCAYKIGGYDILFKWLKERSNNELKYEDIKAFGRLVESCEASLIVQNKIDKIISSSGGLPINSVSIRNEILNKVGSAKVSTPKTGFNYVLDLRLGIASKVIDVMKDSKDFNRVKFAKAFYLADVISGFDLKTEYVRDAAGPVDHRSLYNEKIGIESVAASRGFFEAEKKRSKSDVDFVQYKIGPKLKDGIVSFQKLFGKSAEKIENVLELVAPMSREQIEIVATLYACWSDLLIGKKKLSDEEIIKEFKEKWHPEKTKKFQGKKPVFTEKQLLKAINWMREKNIVPSGNAKRTKDKFSAKDIIPF